MEILDLQKAQWKQKKKSAELSVAGSVVLKMEFGDKKTRVAFDKRRLEIKREGFWHPQILITEDDKILLTQKHIGFWGNKNQVLIGEEAYEGKTQSNTLYNVSYVNTAGQEVIAYRLNALKWKAAVTFTINEGSTVDENVLLLFILGYYTIRAVIQENAADTTVIAAGA